MRNYPELSSFTEIAPNNILPQEFALKWMAESHCRADNIANGLPVDRTDRLAFFEKLLTRYGVSPSKISARGSEVKDPLLKWSESEIYKLTEPNDEPHGADIRVRTHYFAERAYDIFKCFYPTGHNAPDHIVHVTCTGYISPSGAQRIVADRQWNESTAVTHSYHMGCYASLPGVRMAEALVGALDLKKQGREVSVDVVHTEMCSLHMDPADHSPEQLVVQSLFADGAIKYSVTPAGKAKNGFKILNIEEQIIPESEGMMSWLPSAHGMSMTLSREVPEKIGNLIKPFLVRLLAGTDIELSDALKNAKFAVHPGGPKIIDSVQNILELSSEQVSESNKILFERGNMSSATLPHIWNEILKKQMPSGTVVVSLAFGPGLTIFGSVFKII